MSEAHTFPTGNYFPAAALAASPPPLPAVADPASFGPPPGTFLGGAGPAPLPLPGQMTSEAMRQLEEVVDGLGKIITEARSRGDESTLKKAEGQLREARRLMGLMDGTRTGARDAAVLLAHQPTAKQLALPGRRRVVLARATERMKKSKTAFMHPDQILGCCAAVMAGLPEADVFEAEHRILHFLSEASLARDGKSAAAFLLRLGRSGRTAAAGSADHPEVLKMRDTLCDFLADARGRA